MQRREFITFLGGVGAARHAQLALVVEIMTIKSARDLIEEFVRAVRPPQGCAIVLTELVPSTGFDFNWLASAGDMPAIVVQRYDSALIEMKRQNPRINWDGVTDLDSEGVLRRITRYSSEVK